MCRRLAIYFREMYPILPRLALGLIIFGEIHFIILLNAGIRDFRLGPQELIGGFTVFSFLLWLRLADDFKDYELDCCLFADRPLPSGRVYKAEPVPEGADPGAYGRFLALLRGSGGGGVGSFS